ncbi:MAG: EAL domain-containing protein [Acetobacteraceae bacterium]|nr:EAL domain-containing protein [Acetobacteraceae bacterium]
MPLRAAQTKRVEVEPGRVLVLARDPRVIATARDAARRVRRSTAILETGKQALTLLTAPGRADHQLVCDPGAAETACWPDLLAAAAEQRGRTPLLVVSDHPVRRLPRGMQPVPMDSALLAAALRAQLAPVRESGLGEASLRSGLGRGEIAVRYQPMIRIADRQPVMVEALARWAPSYPPIAPDHFLPLAASAGLMRPLSMVVAGSAAREIGPLRQRGLRVGVTLNLPLDLLRQPDLACWLGRLLRGSALRPDALAIELTEHAEVHDRSALERVLVRLRLAGHGVFLDDILLDDPRRDLFGLPFAGLKLDRSLVTALPTQARARQVLRRMVRRAEAAGQVLVAEGVSHPMQLRMLGEMGIDWAQGFLISRPVPASALRAWAELWRAGRPL